jgi:putative solute:sodium symporter small subunit
MTLTERHVSYWRRTLVLTFGLLAIWLAVTFLPVWFAPSLSSIRFLGWPLGFYMVAQGSVVVYVLLIWIYYRRMRSLDREHGVAEGGAR